MIVNRAEKREAVHGSNGVPRVTDPKPLKREGSSPRAHIRMMIAQDLLIRRLSIPPTLPSEAELEAEAAFAFEAAEAFVVQVSVWAEVDEELGE